MLQAFAYIGLIIGLVLYFDWAWLVAGLAYSWILFLVGASCGLHKYSSHRSFDRPVNQTNRLLPFFDLCKFG